MIASSSNSSNTANTGRVGDPIGKAEFARLMRALEPDAGTSKPAHICSAVSGGVDSMALTLLAAHWATTRHIDFTALTVDHGLRPESRIEARQVGAWLGERGISHKVLTWRGSKPQANVQALARTARYRLLGGWCKRHGVGNLLLAHHQDDQAETFLLRLMRGSGVDGLAAMASLSERDGLRLLRPLLSLPKCRLAATCGKFKQPWIDDPSNQSARFTRVRVRKLMAEFEAEGLTAARLAATSGHMAQARGALEEAALQLVLSSVVLYPQGYAEIDAKPLSAAPREIGLRALSLVLRRVGGGHYPARYDRLKAVFEALCHGTLKRGRTLAGCHLAAQSGSVRVVRENRDIEWAPLRPGAAVLWDGRFDVYLRRQQGVVGKGLQVGAMGSTPWSEVRRRIAKFKAENGADAPPASLPSRVRQTLPALWRGPELLAVPHLGYAKGATGRAFGAEFRPLPR